jgi:hypothetical protein
MNKKFNEFYFEESNQIVLLIRDKTMDFYDFES